MDKYEINLNQNKQKLTNGISGNSGGRSFRYEQLKKALIKYGEKPVDILVSDLTYKAADENKCITSYTKTYGLSMKDGVFVKAVLLYGG